MVKKHATIYLVLGAIAGLLLTACVGVATGKIDLPTAGNTGIFGPGIDFLQAPVFDFFHPAAHMKSEQALAVQREVLFQFQHWCHGGMH